MTDDATRRIMSTDLYVTDADGMPRRLRGSLAEQSFAWGTWYEKADRQVALTDIGDVRISTVFLGIDHGWRDGPPVLWETMIFPTGNYDYQERYTSREDALAGHERAVAYAAGREQTLTLLRRHA